MVSENQGTKREERDRHSYLFTVRLWPETLGDGRTEWRGKVQHVISGETRYFRDWSTLVTLFLEMVSESRDGDSAIVER